MFARFSPSVLLATLLAALCMGATHSAAGKWPNPAGGPSASGGPEILFTFDDGPHPRYTPRILEQLAERDIQAIFFWVGRGMTPPRSRLSRNVKARQALVQRAIAEGHIVANHTLTHQNLCLLDAADAEQEVVDNQGLLRELTGMPVALFRSPYGARCDHFDELVERMGLLHLHWDIDPQEWRDRDVDRAMSYVQTKLRRLKGRAILLLHDNHWAGPEVLQRTLEWIDHENQRRAQTGKAPFRIVGGSSWVRENIDAGWLQWWRRTRDRARQQLTESLVRLLP